MNFEERIIHKTLKQLDGLEVVIAQEILYKTAMMLNVAKSPINIKKIERVWFPDMKEKQHKIISYLISNGHDHLAVGYCRQLTIYIRTSIWYSKLLPHKCLYYLLANDPSNCLQKLTKENLQNDFRATHFEKKLTQFLMKNKPYKRNKITGGYAILKVFNKIELSEI